MKKITLFAALLGLTSFFYTRIAAQCTVSNLAVQLKSAIPVTGGCEVVFDFSWDQEVNNGNKFAYIHLWRSDQYPDLNANGLAYTNSSDNPTATDLINALATIVIEGNGTATPSIGTVYHPEPAVPTLSTGIDIIKQNINSVLEKMTVRNITVIVPNCSGSGITGDIWASQAANGKNVHCVSSGVSVIVGNPRVTGLLFCNNPRQYSTQISNIGTNSISVTYNIYIDDGDGVYEPMSHDLKITSSPVGPITVDPGNMYQSGAQSYLPYSGQQPYSDQGLWVEVQTAGTNFNTLAFISNTCIPLPVLFSSFTARRDHLIVALAWQTSNELNNTGFEIQRKIGTGNFEIIAFIATQAPGGNSQSQLSYAYTDANATKNISEYRIRQVDMNGQAAYSMTRRVKGMDQKTNLIIYPNPATNGWVNILFEEANTSHEVSLTDIGGRIIRQWHNVSGNSLSIDKLAPGFYFVQIVNIPTREKSVEKIVVMNY